MNVGCNGTVQVTGSSIGWVRQYRGLDMKF